MSVVAIDLTGQINPAYYPMFNSAARELIVYGGAGAGKSYAVAQKIILKAITHKSNIVVVRKYGPSLKLTCWRLVIDLLKKYGLPFKANLAELKITIAGSTINFISVVNTQGEPAERLKSLTDITDIWIEEATELSVDEYRQIRLRLRGEELKEGYRQIVLTFNPIDKNHWIYRDFFETARGERQKYTYRDNRFIDEDYKAELEGLKDEDEVLYQVYTLGEWGVFGEIIYTRYSVEEFDHPADWYDEILAGVDFGYEHPFAWVYLGLRENTCYIIDELYERKLLTAEIAEKISGKQSEHRIIPATFCDSAEPDRIEELARAGINTYGAFKDVADGIMAVKGYKLVIHPRCENLLKEIRGYQRKKDRNGNVLEEPIKANDHSLDSLRYALYSYKRMTAAQPQGVIVQTPVRISKY